MDTAQLVNSFERVYDEHAKGILRFAHFKVSDDSLAHDIAAETFLKYWKKHSSGDVVEKPKSLLYRIAHGLIIDHYRKRGVRSEIEVEMPEEELPGEDNTIETDIDVRNAILDVHSALKTIRKEYADLILLHYVEDLSISEIAAMLEEEENNTRVRLHRALKSLKTKMIYGK